MTNITLQTEGRRIYLVGNTYLIKGAIKEAGGHWDTARKAWWIGVAKRADIERAIERAAPKASAAPVAPQQAPGTDATVAGRAQYKGKTYYIAGREVRGRTHWDDGVQVVASRDGSKVLLYFRDGSSQFWAKREEVQVQKTYDRPQTIAGLAKFAEQRRAEQADGEPRTRKALYEHLEMLDDMDCFDEARRFAQQHGLKY